MDNNGYLTVLQLSKLANVSIQSIYKRLHNPNNQLLNHVKQGTLNSKDGVLIGFTALSEVYGIELSLEDAQQLLNISTQPHNHTKPPQTATETAQEERLIEILQEQIKAKDRQIEQLQEQIENMNEHITNILASMDKAIEQANTLVEHEQQLRMQSMTLIEEKPSVFNFKARREWKKKKAEYTV